jgi:hypothetical protein
MNLTNLNPTLLTLLAKAGSSSAQAAMAQRCLIASENEEGWKWASRSAAKGCPMGQYMLGLCYLNGYHVEQDAAEAERLFRESADRGCVRSLVGLALIMADANHGKMTPEAVKLIKEAADAGDARALYALSELYTTGNGVVKSRTRAGALLQAAADRGFAPALTEVGIILADFGSDAQEFAMGMKQVRKAAKLGEEDAVGYIGNCLVHGSGMKRNVAKGLKILLRLAEKGNRNVINILGRLYAKGIGVERDLQEAIKWYNRLRELGDATIFVTIHELEDELTNGAAREARMKEQSELFHTLEERGAAGDAEAFYQLGVDFEHCREMVDLLQNRKHRGEALEYYKRAAEMGHAVAAVAAGNMYYHGHNRLQADPAEAAKWYAIAANQGDLEGMLGLSHALRATGDQVQSLQWLEKAAAAGFAEAKACLAYHYYAQGDSYDKAFAFALESAQAGSILGLKILASCYANGRGTSVDFVKAMEAAIPVANADDSYAQFLVGAMLLGVYDYPDTDPELGFELLNASADKGFHDAKELLYYISTQQQSCSSDDTPSAH